MEYRKLGKTGLNISALGFGCASYWGMPFHSENEAAAVFFKAVDSGVNFFDTGHSYSLGNAEPRLGRILQKLSPSVKRELLISTKAGTRNGNGKKKTKVYRDYRPEWIKESIELSLKQLGLETIPILHLHGPSPFQLTDELFSTLERLKQEGKFKVLSINSFDDCVIDIIPSMPLVECIMLDYNLMKQKREHQIEMLAKAGIAVMGGGTLANHVYVHPLKKIRGIRDLWYMLRILKNPEHKSYMKKAEESMNWIHHVHGMTANQVAIAFSLANPYLSTAIFGTTRMPHLLENLQSINLKIPPEIWDKIHQLKKI